MILQGGDGPNTNIDPIVATHPLQHYNTTFAYPDLKIHPASNSSAGSSTTPLPSSKPSSTSAWVTRRFLIPQSAGGSSRSDSNIYPDLPGDRNPAAYPLLNLCTVFDLWSSSRLILSVKIQQSTPTSNSIRKCRQANPRHRLSIALMVQVSGFPA